MQDNLSLAYKVLRQFLSKNVDVWFKSTTIYKLSINTYKVIPVGWVCKPYMYNTAYNRSPRIFRLLADWGLTTPEVD